MACKAAACLGVWWSKGQNNIIYLGWWLFCQAQLQAADGQSLAPCPRAPVPGDSAFSTSLLACSRGRAWGTSAEVCIQKTEVYNQKPSAEIPDTPAPFLCETQQANITALLILSCLSFTSHHLVSCRELLASCRQDVEVKKLPGCHNLSLTAILQDTLTQTQGELFRELQWSYLLLSVEMTLCIIIYGWCCSSLSQPWSERIHPQPVLCGHHTQTRESSVGLQAHIMWSSGTPSPSRSSQ